MRLIKQFVVGILSGGWLFMTIAGNAIAAGDTQENRSDRQVSSATWEERVLVRGPTTHAGPEQARADQQRTARQPAAEASRAKTNVTAVRSAQLEQTEAENQVVLASVSADDGYDMIQMDADSYPVEPMDGFYGDCGVGCGAGCGTECGIGCDCGAGTCFYDGCGEGNGYCDTCPGLGLRSTWWARDMSLHVGAHGFKGPVDQGRNGNFGLHEGIEFGAPLGGPWGGGYQVGFTAMQSNFSGDQTIGRVRSADRHQFFLTAGIFRRATCAGLQWGVVFDLLRDTYYTDTDIKQLRAEIGYVYPGGQSEIGYWGAYGVGDDEFLSGDTQVLFETTDLHAVYFRRHFCGGGEGRLWGGFASSGDGLFGADLRVPLGRSWAIENRLNYLSPKETAGIGGQDKESWGLSVRLVWYVGQSAQCAQQSPYRPLLGVADNSVMMVDMLNGD